MSAIEITSLELTPRRLICMIKNAARMSRGNRRHLLWSFVSDLTGHGGTISTEICRELAIDPNQTVGEFLKPRKQVPNERD